MSRDDTANVAPVREYNFVAIAVDHTDRDHADLAVVETIVDLRERSIIENPSREAEAEPAFPEILLALNHIEFEIHSRIYASSVV